MPENEYIKNISSAICDICNPISIILVSNKINTSGDLVSFKLALVVEDSVESISELECSLYMQVDSDIPYDLVLYKLSEWKKFKDDIGTFACKINSTGVYVYGKKL